MCFRAVRDRPDTPSDVIFSDSQRFTQFSNSCKSGTLGNLTEQVDGLVRLADGVLGHAGVLSVVRGSGVPND